MTAAALLLQALLMPRQYPVPPGFAGRFVTARIPTTQKVIALTFDDGPDPVTTPIILAALRENHAHATFFVLGRNARLYPWLLRQIVLDGHAIGTHSFSHAARLDLASASAENSRTSQIVYQATGMRTQLFRPPYGMRDSALNRDARSRGWVSFFWSISSADTATKDPDVVFRNVCFTPGNGEIVLMHDVKPHTAEAVPKILKELGGRGYRFVTLPELMPLAPPAGT